MGKPSRWFQPQQAALASLRHARASDPCLGGKANNCGIHGSMRCSCCCCLLCLVWPGLAWPAAAAGCLLLLAAPGCRLPWLLLYSDDAKGVETGRLSHSASVMCPAA